MSNNNFYFETLQQIQGEMTEDSIVRRIGECNTVLGEITKTAAWEILLKNSKEMIEKLDDSWQDFPGDSAQLKEARILKMASKHIFELPFKYAEELDMLTEELKKRQNPTEIIEKDSDNE